MRRCPEYIIGVRITYFFELHNAIKSRTNYFNGQIIFLFCGNSFSFFVKLSSLNRIPNTIMIDYYWIFFHLIIYRYIAIRDAPHGASRICDKHPMIGCNYGLLRKF